MHPDIKSFWENLGYTIKYAGHTVYVFSFDQKFNDANLNPVLSYNIIQNDKEIPIYLWFGNKYYFEEEILRLIKLKAFI